MGKGMQQINQTTRPTWEAYTSRALSAQIERYGWEIGDFTYGTPKVHEAGFGHLRIGRFCSIALGVEIVLSNHRSSFVTTYPFSALNSLWEHADGGVSDHRAGSVDIGSDVWIGLNACILPGTTVGDGSVIGAGSVVSGVVQPYSIIAGNPAVLKRKRFREEIVERLLSVRWWDLPDDAIDELIPILVSGDVDALLTQVISVRNAEPKSDEISLKGSLVPCAGAWGERSVVTHRPLLENSTDITYYLPLNSDKEWGIFNSGGAAIAGSIDYHGPNHSLRQATEVDVHRFDQSHVDQRRFLYGGVVNPHFGHFLVNTLPRLWQLAYEPLGDRKILVHAGAPKESWFKLPFVAEIFGRLGLDINDFVQFEAPVRVCNLQVPHPSFQEQTFAHVVFGDLCRKIGATVQENRGSKRLKPVFLSKTRLQSGVGRFINEYELVRCLQHYGVEIVYPETLSFADQVQLFADDAVIAGGAGSAFHTGVFSSSSSRIVVINPMQDVNSNFLMLDGLSQHHSEYFYPTATSVVVEEGDRFLTSVKLANPQRTAADLMDRIRTFTGR
jgi:acetyltransferase-like isoleucine patch superfamily enzyme/capsular polysaccharide biosynthesis protein